MQTFKKEYGADWLLVFRHNVPSTGIIYFTEDLLNENYEENRYSILGKIGKSFQWRGRYEFLLEYPALKGYNRWTQSKNPFTTQYNVDVGYKKINVSWEIHGWKGISRSYDQSSSILDGSPHEHDFYYSIGLAKNWNENVIPGPFGYSDVTKLGITKSEVEIKEVKLWIRINNPLCTIVKQRQNRIMFLYFCVFCMCK